MDLQACMAERGSRSRARTEREGKRYASSIPTSPCPATHDRVTMDKAEGARARARGEEEGPQAASRREERAGRRRRVLRRKASSSLKLSHASTTSFTRNARPDPHATAKKIDGISSP